jgi:AcrR family transcriptional regulator
MAKKKKGARAWARLPERSTRWKAQREALLQAAQRAIHRGGPHVSMDEIAAEAGITKPILYRHFGDRRGLARALRDVSLVFVMGSETDDGPDARRAARERIASLYPVVEDPEALRRVAVTWATNYQMFIEFNRNVFNFLRTEDVLGDMWGESERHRPEPIAESFARSFEAIFGSRGADSTAALIWATGLRGMIGTIVDWWTETHACDRFEVERQIDLLIRAMTTGLDRTLPPRPPAREPKAPPRARTAGARPKRSSPKSGASERRPAGR